MLLMLLLAAAPVPAPTASPTPLPVIAAARVATGTPQSLHALPVAASVLDGAAIASASAYTADGLLRSLPGFDRTRSNSLFTNYGQLRVSFAGAGTDRGLVLADGIPAQDGFGGQVDWAAYPVTDLRRAELLLGAGSALYGAGAVGGVLDMLTYAPPAGAVRPAGDVSVEAGTHAFQQEWANAAATIAPRLNAAVSLQRQRMQYFALPPAYASPIDSASQADASMAAVRLRYAAGPSDTLRVEERGAWDDQFEGRPNYTFSRRLAQTSLRYSHRSAGGSLDATLFTRTTFIVNRADRYPAQPGVLRYVQNVPTSESGAALHWTVSNADTAFALLADARHVTGAVSQFGLGGTPQSSASGVQGLWGFAAQETWHTHGFEAVGGARLDEIDEPQGRIDRAVSPRLALRYDLSPHVALRASAGSGLRAPFLNELLRGYFIGNVEFEPNPALVPERSGTVSAGIDVLDARTHVSLDAFDTTVNDAIMFRTIDPTHQRRSNVARTSTQAYLAGVTQRLGPCSRLSLWYSRQRARVTAGPAPIVGKQLQYVPAQSAALDYAARIGTVGAGLSVSYLGQTYADDLNTQALGSAVVAGVHASIPLPGGAELELRADNLTDARYLSSIDRYGPPAVLSAGVTLPLGGRRQQNACLP